MTFAHPTWLWALALIPILLAIIIRRAKTQSSRWHSLRASRLAPFLTQQAATWPRWLSLACLLLALACTLFALARPRTETGIKPEITRGRNLLFALDLSRSMRSTDLKPDRLTQAKTTMFDILDLQPNDRAGLIGFSDSAYLFAPLTNDHNALRETISQIDERWLPSHGTDLTSAINLAIQTLEKTKSDNNALILLSDGEEHSGNLKAVLTKAREKGVHIFTIAVATDQGETIPDPESADGLYHDANGKLVVSKLDTKTLETIAQETQGSFWRISPNIAPAIKQAMLRFDAFELKGKDQKTYREYFPYFLIPALALFTLALLLQTQWQRFAKNPLALFLAFISLAALTPRAHAILPLEQKILPAARSFQALENGFQAYQKNDFPAALTSYSQALEQANSQQTPTAQLGCADTCFQLGWTELSPNKQAFSQVVPDPEFQKWISEKTQKTGSDNAKLRELLQPIRNQWQSAIDHYNAILAQQPNHTAARENLNLTSHYLKLLDQQQKQQEQQNKQDQQKKDQQKDQQKKDQQKQPQNGQKNQPKQGDNDQQGQPKPDPNGEKDPQGGDQPKNDQQQQGGDQKKDDQQQGKSPEQSDQNPQNSDSPEGEKNQQAQGSSGEKSSPQPTKETPQQRAQRLLEQGADLQQNPLVPRLPRPRNGKDW